MKRYAIFWPNGVFSSIHFKRDGMPNETNHTWCKCTHRTAFLSALIVQVELRYPYDIEWSTSSLQLNFILSMALPYQLLYRPDIALPISKRYQHVVFISDFLIKLPYLTWNDGLDISKGTPFYQYHFDTCRYIGQISPSSKIFRCLRSRIT